MLEGRMQGPERSRTCLAEGAALSLFMFPVLFAVVWIQLRFMKRMEGA